MKINKVLIITILLIAITSLIVSFKTQKKITDNKKIDTPKINAPQIDTPKVIVPKIVIHKKEDELSKIVSSLQSIIEDDKEQIKQNQQPTEDEVQNILSNLKELKPKEKSKKIVSKKLHITKRVVKKRKIVKKRRVIKKIVKKRPKIKKKKHLVKYVKPKKNIKCKDIIKSESTMTEEEYRKKLARESKIDPDIASLAMATTVEMDIEQQIREGKRERPTTPKPLVEQQTIFIPSNEKEIDNSIPLAELKEIDEKVDGIFIKKYIN